MCQTYHKARPAHDIDVEDDGEGVSGGGEEVGEGGDGDGKRYQHYLGGWRGVCIQ